ncbi:MAG: recombinase family protein [Clostridiales bacterium]|nr:recombinase family protein [Clostridiales bacterium]
MELLKMREYVSSGRSIFELPLRVAYYARVSSEKVEQLNSLDNQVFYYEDYIKNNKNWTYTGGYVDEGISGISVKKRAGFLQMIEDGKQGKFDLLVTKEISRFARDTLDSIQYTRELLAHGVGVFFQSDNINTLLPDAELRLTIMASIAQDEVRKLSERSRFGFKRAIERGLVMGQNNTLGYNKKDGVLTINEEQARIVRRIFEIYNEGKIGIRRIARQLESEGMLSPYTGKMIAPDTVKAAITNPKYKGYYCSGKTISIDHRNPKRIYLPAEDWNVYKDENIPAIVSEEIWDAANALYRKRSDAYKEKEPACQSRYPFSGKLICAEHGTSYHRHIYKSKKYGEQEVWNCKLYRQKGKVDGCDSPTIYSKELHSILHDIFSRIYAAKDEVIKGLMDIYSSIDNLDYAQEIAKLKQNVKRQQTKKNLILDLLTDGTITKAEFAQRNNSIAATIESLQNEITAYVKQASNIFDRKRSLAQLKTAMEKEFDSENFSADVSSILLDKIIVHKVNGNKSHLRLEIYLTLGKEFLVEVKDKRCISLGEMGISQAQVSRLEKNAINQIRKFM